MSGDDEIVIRSYRRVFRLERRIYRIDRFAIPVPGGIPLRGLAYFVCGLLGVLAASSLPGLASLLALAPLPIRLVALPAAIAVLASQATPDGVPAHRFARNWLRARLSPRRTWNGRRLPASGERALLQELLPYAPDASDPKLRRARLHGPARVSFSVPLVLEQRRHAWCARPAGEADAGSQCFELPAGQRLEVRP